MFALGAAACGGADSNAVTLQILDRRERPVLDAEWVVGDQRTPVDSAALVQVNLASGPVMGRVEADGFLTEPVVVGRDDSGEQVTIALYSSDVHWALHAGGDVMLGRRYVEPHEGDPLLDPVDPSEGAPDVVSDLAPLFTAADVRLINLETVVGELPMDAAYPGKRFLLQTPPGALDALSSLEVDAVDLANNHAYDWLDDGVVSTLDALDRAGLPRYGGGLTPEEAEAPVILEHQGVRIGVIGFTSVDGRFVNDSYPEDGEAIPADLDPAEAWQYEARSWGFASDTWTVPEAGRRAGSAWRLFKAVEDELTVDESAAAWDSLRQTYPELQDWVAHRGHGGAALWDTATSPRAIAALAEQTDVVVVQLHGGFQFLPGISEFVDRMARDASDAGADLVIAHHPHVLQGASWHGDTLIVHSLGNLVFDQDFLATFPSAVLRTVWERDQLVEARFLPVELVGYRPVPVADAQAARTVRTIWERSRLGGLGDRVDGEVRVVQGELDESIEVATLKLDRHTGLVVRQRPSADSVQVEVRKDGVAALPRDVLVDPRLGLSVGTAPDVFVGRDLFGWGDFGDRLADGRITDGAQWVFDGTDERLVVLPDGQVVLELERDGFDEQVVTSRPVARTPLFDHRLWDATGREPADPDPRYALRLRARSTGVGEPHLQVIVYDFDDTDPTRDPSTAVLGEHRMEIDVGRRWKDVLLPIPPEWLVGEGDERANQLLTYVRLDPPRVGRATLQVADLQVLELRRADAMPAVPGAWDIVLNESGETLSLDVPVVRPAD